MSNIERPDRPVDPGWCRLLSVRDFYDHRVLWVCPTCRVSAEEFVQPRCPGCRTLMVRAKS